MSKFILKINGLEFEVYPKHYAKMLNKYDWSKVTQSVDKLYK